MTAFQYVNTSRITCLAWLSPRIEWANGGQAVWNAPSTSMIPSDSLAAIE